MDYLTLERINNLGELKTTDKITQLLSNNCWKLRGDSYITLYPYHVKSNIATRMYFYAVCDLINDDTTPYKAAVKEKILDNVSDYLNRIIYRMLTDELFLKLSATERERQLSIVKHFDNLYESDLQTAFRKLENRLIYIKIKRTSNNQLKHNIFLTKDGVHLKAFIDKKFVF